MAGECAPVKASAGPPPPPSSIAHENPTARSRGARAGPTRPPRAHAMYDVGGSANAIPSDLLPRLRSCAQALCCRGLHARGASKVPVSSGHSSNAARGGMSADALPESACCAVQRRRAAKSACPSASRETGRASAARARARRRLRVGERGRARARSRATESTAPRPARADPVASPRA